MSIDEVKALVFQDLTSSRDTRILYLSMADEYVRYIFMNIYLYIYLYFMIFTSKDERCISDLSRKKISEIYLNFFCIDLYFSTFLFLRSCISLIYLVSLS